MTMLRPSPLPKTAKTFGFWTLARLLSPCWNTMLSPMFNLGHCHIIPEWSANATIPAIPVVLDLYEKLLEFGFKIVFISASRESQRKATEENLKQAGYSKWERLILKDPSENGLTSGEFKAKKRTELVGEWYRIRGNLGDQWSDLSHPNPGDRTFKFPNPVFYIP